MLFFVFLRYSEKIQKKCVQPKNLRFNSIFFFLIRIFVRIVFFSLFALLLYDWWILSMFYFCHFQMSFKYLSINNKPVERPFGDQTMEMCLYSVHFVIFIYHFQEQRALSHATNNNNHFENEWPSIESKRIQQTINKFKCILMNAQL